MIRITVYYIKVKITKASDYWWQLAEIQWGSYANGTFTRMAASGSVTTEGKTETQVTIKGIKGGETTIVIDGKTYPIKKDLPMVWMPLLVLVHGILSARYMN